MLRAAVALGLAWLLGGCANLSYYAQAVSGHLQVMGAARPIPQLVNDAGTTPALRTQLAEVAVIREFASRELALPDNGSYRSYADLGRPFVVWNVFAAKEFSVDLESWCMLFVGCVNYRGYYDKAAAERLAGELRGKGLETYVANIPAYSTLGFFDDPVLNTFLRFGDQEVARIIFHELAHQTVFVRGDSTFNESFATAVENEGMRRWLARRGPPGALRNFQEWQRRKFLIQSLVADYRERLREIYARPGEAEAKRAEKAEALADLRRDYAAMRADWGSAASGYDAFFGSDLNNAKLGSVSLYTKLVPAFETLLEQTSHNLPAFYRRVKELSRLGKEEREAVMERLLEAALRPRNI